MAAKVGDTFPNIAPVAADNIPQALKGLRSMGHLAQGTQETTASSTKSLAVRRPVEHINGQDPTNWIDI